MAFTSTDLSKPATPYVHQEFPKYVTHATEPARVVANDAAWQALGPGWGRPEDPTPPPPEPRPVAVTDGFTASVQDEHDQPVLPKRKRGRG